ncbi:MAG: hypothetical protein HXX08_25135 [Chloroflexi bacterium]|uniref:Uncharacterized protein n=1 Tax=Candidatus Chlorohelix allophototropha TaxID=3003348 RepID=A0A8T7MAJ8_9CHLR|nr:hypothetical protein [Chloroflexota bacterium]NWJ49155.1 hypothetical protein [Chloroflexota bacterium]WJW68841.1 hypothetical protein OZ401_004460 [Chloroflexota bacterium L227-S17]
MKNPNIAVIMTSAYCGSACLRPEFGFGRSERFLRDRVKPDGLNDTDFSKENKAC